jgi:hypothetical protein
MSAAIESMTRLQIGDLRIRIWREEASLVAALDASANLDLRDWADEERANMVLHGDQPHPLALFGALKKFQRISAIEIVDGDGFGAVEYIAWP